MNEVKRKILLDLFAAPSTTIPVALGITAIMGGWALDGSPAIYFLGVASILAGVGMLATRWVFGLDKITKDAQQYKTEAEKKSEQDKLDDLFNLLKGDGDVCSSVVQDDTGRSGWPLNKKIRAAKPVLVPVGISLSPAQCLTELRRIKYGFDKAVEAGQVTGAARALVADKITNLFDACIKQLELSHQMWQTANGLRGKARVASLQDRERVVKDIKETVELLEQTVQQCYSSKAMNGDEDLSSMRAELQKSMEIAKQTDNKMNNLVDKGYKDSEFEQS